MAGITNPRLLATLSCQLWWKH